MEQCPIDPRKGVAILVIRSLRLHKGKASLRQPSQDTTASTVGCRKKRVGEVETWFNQMDFRDANDFVSGNSIETAWNEFNVAELLGGGVTIPTSRLVLRNYERGFPSVETPTYGEYARERHGWNGQIHVVESSSTGGAYVTTDDVLPLSLS